MTPLERLRASLRGLFASIEIRLSPNRSSRYGSRVQGVVIHTTEGSFAGSLGWMLNSASDVSAHYLVSDVERPGEQFTQVVQLVPEDEKAWTAKSANPVTINYELAGFARKTRDEWLNQHRAQLETTAALVAEDVLQYQIPVKRAWPGILGHRDLNAVGFPNDHWDPGTGFPWDVFLQRVRHYVLRAQERPEVVKQPAKRPPCLPDGLDRIPKPAYALAKWHLSGRKGPKPPGTPKHIKQEWPWYWDWFHCKFFGRHPDGA